MQQPTSSAARASDAASANGHQRAASSCHAPCSRLISPRCVCKRACLCHCNECVSPPEWASHKQMGSWKATSHIVTEEIPFFCPQSWWHRWPRRTAQSRPEGGHRPSVLTHRRHKWAQRHLPFLTRFSLSPIYFTSRISSPKLHKMLSSCADSLRLVLKVLLTTSDHHHGDTM